VTRRQDKPGERAVEITGFDAELSDQAEADWLRTIAESLKPADGYLGAMFGRVTDQDAKEWRLLAYVGDAWERAGDGWAAIKLTDSDPITLRDEAAVRAIWKDCIAASRADHEKNKRGAA
jgi:hypothetical protein